MKNIFVQPVVYPRNNKTFDATVLVCIGDYSIAEKPEVLHKYVRLGFHSRHDASSFAYNEALHIQDIMLSSAHQYLAKFKDAQ